MTAERSVRITEVVSFVESVTTYCTAEEVNLVETSFTEEISLNPLTVLGVNVSVTAVTFNTVHTVAVFAEHIKLYGVKVVVDCATALVAITSDSFVVHHMEQLLSVGFNRPLIFSLYKKRCAPLSLLVA